ncbi:hypothetical protein HanIR_Chr07g0327931 [Helianthus annuus]|nr:hypothetical protein HanIR_Chr07g0327931 [Helianthus annuus]
MAQPNLPISNRVIRVQVLKSRHTHYYTGELGLQLCEGSSCSSTSLSPSTYFSSC